MNETNYAICPNGMIREYNITTGETIRFITNEEYDKELSLIEIENIE